MLAKYEVDTTQSNSTKACFSGIRTLQWASKLLLLGGSGIAVVWLGSYGREVWECVVILRSANICSLWTNLILTSSVNT